MIDEYQRKLRFLHTEVLISLLCFGGILLSGGVGCVWAENPGSGTALVPGYTGTNYSFSGNYAAGQITINSSGTYYLTASLNASSSDFGILIQGEGITLDGNLKNLSGTSRNGINVTSSGNDTTIQNFGNISGFSRGIYAEGHRLRLIKNCIAGNTDYAVFSRGGYLNASDNIVFGNHNGLYAIYGEDFAMHAYPFISNNTVFDNTLNGIYSGQNYARIFKNTVYENGQYGIFTGGSNCGGTDPGTCGSGYYANISGNTAYDNAVGIYMVEPSSYARDNVIFDNQRGIRLGSSMNVSVFNNTIRNSTQGIYLPEGKNLQVALFQNRIINSSDSGISFGDSSSSYRRGNGTIFDNYLGNQENVKANQSLRNFTWTHPAGPVPGTNVMGGPYVAGNYWSSPNGTGWSDKQPGNLNGYTITSYEVAPGANDTAPLVKTLTPTPSPTISPTPTPGLSYIINATSNDLGSINPSGVVSVPAGGNMTFRLQTRPGAEITNLTVDGSPASIQPGNTYTFADVVADHSIRLTCTVKKGIIIAGFNANITSNPSPLTIQFTDTSYGAPTMWFWMFGDGNWSTLQNPVYTYTKAGTKTVRLWVRNLYTSGIITKKGYINASSSGPSIDLVPIPSFTSDRSDASVMMDEIPQDIKNLMMKDNVTPLDSSYTS